MVPCQIRPLLLGKIRKVSGALLLQQLVPAQANRPPSPTTGRESSSSERAGRPHRHGARPTCRPRQHDRLEERCEAGGDAGVGAEGFAMLGGGDTRSGPQRSHESAPAPASPTERWQRRRHGIAEVGCGCRRRRLTSSARRRKQHRQPADDC